MENSNKCRDKVQVSVPLRGFRHESAAVWSNQYIKRVQSVQFPSPCGVLGMKVSRCAWQWGDSDTTMFPSPCGVLGMKEHSSINLVSKTWIVSVPLRGFRHESDKKGGWRYALKMTVVSVPLRGFRHERGSRGFFLTLSWFVVSVPLRGFRHESRKWFKVGCNTEWFPSPCGVLGMKVKESELWRNRYLAFPSPCGVLGMKDLTFLRLTQ